MRPAELPETEFSCVYADAAPQLAAGEVQSFDQRLALDAPAALIGLTWRLAVDQTVRPKSIEPHHPVPNDLQRHAANLRRLVRVAPS